MFGGDAFLAEYKMHFAHYMRRVHTHYNAGNYDECVKCYCELLTNVQLSPYHRFGVHRKLAHCYYVTRRYLEAIHHIHSALALHSADEMCYIIGLEAAAASRNWAIFSEIFLRSFEEGVRSDKIMQTYLELPIPYHVRQSLMRNLLGEFNHTGLPNATSMYNSQVQHKSSSKTTSTKDNPQIRNDFSKTTSTKDNPQVRDNSSKTTSTKDNPQVRDNSSKTTSTKDNPQARNNSSKTTSTKDNPQIRNDSSKTTSTKDNPQVRDNSSKTTSTKDNPQVRNNSSKTTSTKDNPQIRNDSSKTTSTKDISEVRHKHSTPRESLSDLKEKTIMNQGSCEDLFQKYVTTCKNAAEAHLKFKRPLLLFEEALGLATQLPTVTPLATTLLKYLLCEELLETVQYDGIARAVSILKSIVDDFSRILPALYVTLTRAFVLLNRFESAKEWLCKGNDFIDKKIRFPQHHYPETMIIMEGTTFQYVMNALRELTTECNQYHPPDAVCRYDRCLHIRANCHILPSKDIYFSDPDFDGFIIVSCTHKCNLQYHSMCWKDWKSHLNVLKTSDQHVLFLPCMTPDCSGKIQSLRHVGKDGQIKCNVDKHKELDHAQNIEPTSIKHKTISYDRPSSDEVKQVETKKPPNPPINDDTVTYKSSPECSPEKKTVIRTSDSCTQTESVPSFEKFSQTQNDPNVKKINALTSQLETSTKKYDKLCEKYMAIKNKDEERENAQTEERVKSKNLWLEASTKLIENWQAHCEEKMSILQFLRDNFNEAAIKNCADKFLVDWKEAQDKVKILNDQLQREKNSSAASPISLELPPLPPYPNDTFSCFKVIKNLISRKLDRAREDIFRVLKESADEIKLAGIDRLAPHIPSLGFAPHEIDNEMDKKEVYRFDDEDLILPTFEFLHTQRLSFYEGSGALGYDPNEDEFMALDWKDIERGAQGTNAIVGANNSVYQEYYDFDQNVPLQVKPVKKTEQIPTHSARSPPKSAELVVRSRKNSTSSNISQASKASSTGGPGRSTVFVEHARAVYSRFLNFIFIQPLFAAKSEYQIRRAMEAIRKENRTVFKSKSLPEIMALLHAELQLNFERRIVLQKFTNFAWEQLSTPPRQHPDRNPLLNKSVDECSICFDPIGHRNVTTLKCSHTFHSRCLEVWLKSDHTCPLCRDYVVANEEYPALPN